MEDRLLRTARLLPGEPLGEVSQLAVIYDSEVDAYCLRLMASADDPPVAEYWFASLERTEGQASTVFGARFAGWDEREA